MPPLNKADLELMRERFDTLHEQNSGHKAETEPVELVSLRLISLGLVPQAKLSPGKVTGTQSRSGQDRRTQGFFRQRTRHAQRRRFTIAICSSRATKLCGPAIVEQLDTTTVIHPEQEATVDEYRNIIIKEKKKIMRQQA